MRGSQAEMRLRHQMQFLYQDINFKGKNVLDIGGGIGLHSFYALAMGAKSAVIVEPEGDGSHSQMIATFSQLRDALNVKNIRLTQTTLQSFHSEQNKFDVVLIQDAINHFDEPACINLRISHESQRIYDQIFRKIAGLITVDGYLMLSDCSSSNLYPMLGLKNPFDPNIEWHKHQPPSVWEKLARAHGLEQRALRWSTPTRLGAIGRKLSRSCFLAWFFTSHFAITFQKSR